MNRLLIVVSSALMFAWATSSARAADVVLNEYNAVSSSKVLENGASDPFWCQRAGNGGDWFELVVVTDHLDVRGWDLVVVDDATNPAGGRSFSLELTQDPAWSDLRSGTIITVSEDLANNAERYQPAAGRWWINVRASAATGAKFVEVTCISPSCDPAVANWNVSESNWQLTIKDAAGNVVFGPAGEGIQPLSGVSASEIFKLEEAPSGATTPLSNYQDGSSSTFGSPNRFDGGSQEQDLSALRSVVPFLQLTSVRVNEILSHSDPGVDWVELHNTTAAPVDVGGWYLSDTFDDLTLFEIPAGTTIAPGGYLVFDQLELGFGFSSACGEQVILSAADALGLTGERDVAEFGPVENGVSLGRPDDGAGQFLRLASATRGAANSGPRVSPVVINEIMYHPADPPLGSTVGGEFIELYNAGASAVELSATYVSFGTIGWRLGGGIDFTFPPGQTVAPGAYLLVVDFDPVADPVALAEFRSRYSLGDSAAVVGLYTGKLDNFSDRVAIIEPDTPSTDGNLCGGTGNPPPYVPAIVVDEVEYVDCGLWPAAADGTGASLERIDPRGAGNDAANWSASLNASPTPGGRNSVAAVTSTTSTTGPLATTTTIAVTTTTNAAPTTTVVAQTTTTVAVQTTTTVAGQTSTTTVPEATSTTLASETTTTSTASTTTSTLPATCDATCVAPCSRCEDGVCSSRCGMPVAMGARPSVTDALFLLRSSVALESCALCVCDVDADGHTTVRDALRLLKRVVGGNATIQCSTGAS